MRAHTCRGCGALVDNRDVFADLGVAPLANALLLKHQLDHAEIHYPLRVLVCRDCLLVQLPHLIEPQTLFSDDYPFRSGMSAAWLEHCKDFAHIAQHRFALDGRSRVLEIGSNDGTGLLAFQGRGIPAMGIEPCRQVAEEALADGIATTITFWTQEYAARLVNSGYKANLVLARNVLAHVPDLFDFLAGIRHILAPNGTAVFEVPYVGNLIRESQWDQIYHEHHCYFSLVSLERALGRAGLVVVDVEHLPVHGGSMRVYARCSPVDPSGSVAQWHKQEAEQGLHQIATYLNFANEPAYAKRLGWRMLVDRYAQAQVIGYGASAKAATTLNYFGAGPDMIECVADVTPSKWGRYLPGVRIPVVDSQELATRVPGVVINFCWNWRTESEANIRRLCPKAYIAYLHEPHEAAFINWLRATAAPE